MSLMTPARVARLRRDVNEFVSGKPQVRLSEVIKHVNGLGWQTVRNEMFAGWLRAEGIHVNDDLRSGRNDD